MWCIYSTFCLSRLSLVVTTTVLTNLVIVLIPEYHLEAFEGETLSCTQFFTPFQLFDKSMPDSEDILKSFKDTKEFTCGSKHKLVNITEHTQCTITQ